LWRWFYVGSLSLVDGQIGRSQFDIEQVLAPGQMQRAGWRCQTLPLLKDVGDIVAAKGSKFESVFDRASDLVRAIDFAQGHDFGDMEPGIEATILELAIILLSPRAQRLKCQQRFGIASFCALTQELFSVIGIFDVLMTVVTAGVGSDQLPLMINAEPVGELFKR
jgi:hypothetical protein